MKFTSIICCIQVIAVVLVRNKLSTQYHEIFLHRWTVINILYAIFKFYGRDTGIKGLIWPPLEPKTKIAFDWFIRRKTEW